jgi:TATA-box binding protein (TBP) (component of TFIID and TFIIIB)
MEQSGFPGVMVKAEDPNTVILLFDSGKMVADGPSIEAVTDALTKLSSRLASGMKT